MKGRMVTLDKKRSERARQREMGRGQRGGVCCEHGR